MKSQPECPDEDGYGKSAMLDEKSEKVIDPSVSVGVLAIRSFEDP
jgi:hypothetical protein